MKLIISESQLKFLTENITDSVRLRKLTFRSKWDFSNKHQGWTIEEVFKHNPKSILWAYLNLQAISFTDDVLSELQKKFPRLQLIEKPGIDKEQFEYITDFQNPWKKYSYPELKNIITAMKINKERIPKLLYDVYWMKKDQYIKDKKDSKDPFQNVDTKAKMQGKNQGHQILQTFY